MTLGALLVEVYHSSPHVSVTLKIPTTTTSNENENAVVDLQDVVVSLLVTQQGEWPLPEGNNKYNNKRMVSCQSLS